MKIKRLEISSPWKNLEGLCIDLSECSDITVFLGKNGSSKSNLLEAIVIIFKQIDLNEPSLFSYKIDYSINGNNVSVTAEKNGHAFGTLNGKRISKSKLRADWFPKYVVCYYSGVSDRFEEIFFRHDNIALDATLKADDLNSKDERLHLKRFIYARPVHGLFSLLAFYYSDDIEVIGFLRNLPRIENFDSVLLILRKPLWAKNNNSDDFWGARGPVADLLHRFKKYSLAPFSRVVNVKSDFRRRERRDLVYLYLPDLESLRSLAAEYGKDPRNLFQALDTMRLSGLIEDFKVRVKVSGANGAISLRQLSEGEQQLLTVIGLLRFTSSENSLYILDEPDTHLNPAWGVEYLNYLRDIGRIDRNSHTFLATHDPVLVAGLVKEEIRILSRDINSCIRAEMPEQSPRGMGIAGVLTSPLYGLESQLDSFSLRVLKRIYEVTISQEGKQRSRNLARLRKLVPSLATAESLPDPYRNIAQEAYKMAIASVMKSEANSEMKSEAIKRLSDKLYTEAIAEK